MNIPSHLILKEVEEEDIRVVSFMCENCDEIHTGLEIALAGARIMVSLTALQARFVESAIDIVMNVEKPK